MSKIPDRISKSAKSRELKPTIRVGKSGISASLIEEISGQLKSRELVKIKINRGLFERETLPSLWEHLAEETSSVLVLSRGNIGVLWRT